MANFTDNANRKWLVSINVATIKRVRELMGVDLLAVVSEAGSDLLAQLATDPLVLCNVLYCACKPQADDANVTEEQFGEALAGDVIEQATGALLESLADFFPSRKRELLKQALAKLNAFQESLLDQAQAKIDDPELDAKLKELLNSGG